MNIGTRKILDRSFTALGIGSIVVMAIALLIVLVPIISNLVMWAVLAVGLCNSVMFPTIFSLAINGLGKHARQGLGILCTAIVGGAILPLIQGVFADNVGIQSAFIIPVLCYAYIAFYGYSGHRLIEYQHD